MDDHRDERTLERHNDRWENYVILRFGRTYYRYHKINNIEKKVKWRSFEETASAHSNEAETR